MTATNVGNTGTRTREDEARHPAEWFKIYGEPEKPEIRDSRTVHIEFDQPTVYIYNTAVWCQGSVDLTFADDFSSVAVVCDQWTDDST